MSKSMCSSYGSGAAHSAECSVSLQSTSRLKGDRTCNSHGCSQRCACFEEEFLSLNYSIKEALPSVPSSQQLEVVKVVEATQAFCCDCVGPVLKHSASRRTSANISGPKFFPLDLFEDSEQEQLPAEGTPGVSFISSSQVTRVAPSQCKSRRTRRRRQRTKRHALSSDPILGLWRRVENLLSQCSQDVLDSAVLQLEESVPESQDESFPDGLLINFLILFLQAPRWEKEPSSLRFRMLSTSWRISPLSRLFISGAPMSLSVGLQLSIG